jgi:hypothetical protein
LIYITAKEQLDTQEKRSAIRIKAAERDFLKIPPDGRWGLKATDRFLFPDNPGI